jgi:hypothetical protein
LSVKEEAFIDHDRRMTQSPHQARDVRCRAVATHGPKATGFVTNPKAVIRYGNTVSPTQARLRLKIDRTVR